MLAAANLRIDGYLIKPLSFDKLYNVLEKIINRIKVACSSVYIAENTHYSFSQKSLTVNNEVTLLGNKERKLLEILLSNMNIVISRDEIIKDVWGNNIVSESAIKSLFSEIRKKLQYNVIINIPKIGWMIKIDES